MKSLSPIAFAALLSLSLLNSSAAWAAPASAGALPRTEAPKNAPRVTRDNFVSLSWEQSDGAGIIAQTKTCKVEGNVLSYNSVAVQWGGVGGGGGGFGNFPSSVSVPQTQGVSNLQLDELIQKMNSARLTALVGNYRQPNLTGGVQESLVVTISDKNNRDQKFVIQNYGNTAPKSYFEFTTYFRDFASLKIPGAFVTPVVPVSPGAIRSDP